MAELDVDQLFRQLHLQRRRKLIRSLLAGNDTQCFTTKQYRDKMFDRCMTGKNGSTEESIAAYDKLAHEQLTEEGLTEVKPGIWAKIEA